jgi:hypothetical protein
LALGRAGDRGSGAAVATAAAACVQASSPSHTQASIFDHPCSVAHQGHRIVPVNAGMSSKLRGSVSTPDGKSSPVRGQRTISVPTEASHWLLSRDDTPARAVCQFDTIHRRGFFDRDRERRRRRAAWQGPRVAVVSGCATADTRLPPRLDSAKSSLYNAAARTPAPARAPGAGRVDGPR